ncbi:unnamed protein product [Lactuca saligna]|uniref:MULE transposase domain-containing protein n=1 Tax=Lactuca saligna TaxID=75948 RepID=A0AA35ZPG3_LACSI|nr:unnamed protein product [Lactuca saligna]
MYLCFKAIKEGWKIGCCRVIGLDGSFLKWTYKGELLTAIGRDANNQVYPIAWAVVVIENKANWKWFLEMLTEDLNLLDRGGFTIISYQHKDCLKQTRKYYQMWSIDSVQDTYMLTLGRPIMEWSSRICSGQLPFQLVFFSTDVACGVVENGIAECFNAIILDARKKPILAMLEDIRLYMMDRFYHTLQKVEKWESVVCPTAIKKMNKFGEDLRNWNVNLNGPSIFEAMNGLEGFKAIYENNILHVNGRNVWPRTSYTKPLTPLARRILGRPTLKRKRGGVRGSRGGAMGSRGGIWGKRGGAAGNTGGADAKGNRGGTSSKRGGRGSKTSVGIESSGVAEVEGGGVENEDATIPEK